MAKREPNCQVCRSPDRALIEQGLANGTSAQYLANKFELHKQAIWRHKKEHMTAELKQRLKFTTRVDPIDVEKTRMEAGESLLTHLIVTQGYCYRMMDDAEKFGGIADRARATASMHANIKLAGQLVGELNTGTTINNTLVLTEDYNRVRQGITLALKPFPKARAAVVAFLRGMEEIQPPAIEHQP
jgi:hypothetical protein